MFQICRLRLTFFYGAEYLKKNFFFFFSIQTKGVNGNQNCLDYLLLCHKGVTKVTNPVTRTTPAQHPFWFPPALTQPSSSQLLQLITYHPCTG